MTSHDADTICQYSMTSAACVSLVGTVTVSVTGFRNRVGKKNDLWGLIRFGRSFLCPEKNLYMTNKRPALSHMVYRHLALIETH